jgi:hypothetical protein
VLSRRVASVLADDLGLELVVRGLDNNVLGKRKLCEVNVVLVGSGDVSAMLKHD